MPQSPNVLPWQEGLWQRLTKMHETNTLPHAFLFLGLQGLGKSEFATLFSNLLLCQSPVDHQPCEQCHACQLFQSGTHPDFHLIAPEEPGKAIKIDQIRKLIGIANQTAQLDGFRVILINPADSMNTASANALLKTLEEPGERTAILLVSEHLSQIPATIRSRCQLIHFPMPSQAESQDWLSGEGSAADLALSLKLANGAPLQALSLIESEALSMRKEWFKNWYYWQQNKIGLSELVKVWQEAELSTVLFHLNTWLMDVIRLYFNANESLMTNADLALGLGKLAARVDIQKLYAYLDELNQAQRSLRGQINLNQQLLLENLLVRWMDVLHRHPPA